jgi:hypothetical protein
LPRVSRAKGSSRRFRGFLSPALLGDEETAFCEKADEGERLDGVMSGDLKLLSLVEQLFF